MCIYKAFNVNVPDFVCGSQYKRTNGPVNAHLRTGIYKIGQGHPKVMIYINFVELLSLMLHAKFQNHRPSGSGEEDFKGFLLFIAMAAILVM